MPFFRIDPGCQHATVAILTNAKDSSVFTVKTVVISNSGVLTVSESSLAAGAVEIVEVDGRQSTTKGSACEWDRVLDIDSVVQLSANHLGLLEPPTVVTDGAPLVIEADLDTTFVGCNSVHQTNVSLGAVILRYWNARSKQEYETTQQSEFVNTVIKTEERWCYSNLLHRVDLSKFPTMHFWVDLLVQNTAASDICKSQKKFGNVFTLQSKMWSSFPRQVGSFNRTPSDRDPILD